MKKMFLFAALACMAMIVAPVIAVSAPTNTELIFKATPGDTITLMTIAAAIVPAPIDLPKTTLAGRSFIVASQPMIEGATPTYQPRYKLRC